MKITLSALKKKNIFYNTSMVLKSSSQLFVTLLVTFVLFRIIALNAYVKYKVVNGLTESMPSLEYSEALRRSFLYQTEPLMLGISSDVIVAVILAILLYRLNKALQQFIVIALCIFLAANIEHIFVNSAHISFGFIPAGMDPTFIQAEADLGFFKKVFVLVIGALSTFWLIQSDKLKSILSIFVVLLSTVSFILTHSGAFPYPTWLATNPLFNIKFSKSLLIDKSYPPDNALAPNEAAVNINPSLNIILLYLEGVSRKSIIKANMKNLESLANQNIEFTNYYARQIITANGLYASHTGYTPAFTKRYSKWNEMTAESKDSINALPQLLFSAGYHTAFLQAAPLSYMDKNEKMKLLGYEEVFGDSNWSKENAYSYNGWGIDDRSLYSNLLDYIANISKKEEPWFVAALTSGTHSPYNVPGKDKPTRVDALHFADVALGEFVAALKERRLLDNTLLVITSDEGRETSNSPGMFNSLPQSQLPLVLVHPYFKPKSYSLPLLNTDLPNIISTSVASNTVEEMRDSLPKHQHLVFGNFITQRVFWYNITSKNISACNFSFVCKRVEGIDDLSILETKVDNSFGISMPAFEQYILKHE